MGPCQSSSFHHGAETTTSGVLQDVSATPTSPAAGAMNYEALENATNTSQIEAAGGYGDRSLLAAGGTGGQLPQDKKLKLAFSELQNCPDSAQMNSQVLHAVKGTDSSSSEPAAYTAADIAFKNKNRGLAVSEYSEQLVATHPDVVGISSSAANKLNEGVPSALSESCVLCFRYRHNVKIQLDLSRCLDGKEREHMVHKQVSTCVFLLEDDEAGVPLRDCDVVKALEEKKLLLGHEIGSSATSDTSSGGTPHQSSLSMNTFHQSSMAVSILEVVDVLGAPVLLWDSKDELRIYGPGPSDAVAGMKTALLGQAALWLRHALHEHKAFRNVVKKHLVILPKDSHSSEQEKMALSVNTASGCHQIHVMSALIKEPHGGLGQGLVVKVTAVLNAAEKKEETRLPLNTTATANSTVLDKIPNTCPDLLHSSQPLKVQKPLVISQDAIISVESQLPQTSKVVPTLFKDVLAALPLMVTVLEVDVCDKNDGRCSSVVVVFQNQGSLRYWGDLPLQGLAARTASLIKQDPAETHNKKLPPDDSGSLRDQPLSARSPHDAGGFTLEYLLQHLLRGDTDCVQEALQAGLQENRPWRNVLQVPARCWTPASISDYFNEDTAKQSQLVHHQGIQTEWAPGSHQVENVQSHQLSSPSQPPVEMLEPGKVTINTISGILPADPLPARLSSPPHQQQLIEMTLLPASQEATPPQNVILDGAKNNRLDDGPAAYVAGPENKGVIATITSNGGADETAAGADPQISPTTMATGQPVPKRRASRISLFAQFTNRRRNSMLELPSSYQAGSPRLDTAPAVPKTEDMFGSLDFESTSLALSSDRYLPLSPQHQLLSSPAHGSGRHHHHHQGSSSEHGQPAAQLQAADSIGGATTSRGSSGSGSRKTPSSVRLFQLDHVARLFQLDHVASLSSSIDPGLAMRPSSKLLTLISDMDDAAEEQGRLSRLAASGIMSPRHKAVAEAQLRVGSASRSSLRSSVTSSNYHGVTSLRAVNTSSTSPSFGKFSTASSSPRPALGQPRGLLTARSFRTLSSGSSSSLQQQNSSHPSYAIQTDGGPAILATVGSEINMPVAEDIDFATLTHKSSMMAVEKLPGAADHDDLMLLSGGSPPSPPDSLPSLGHSLLSLPVSLSEHTIIGFGIVKGDSRSGDNGPDALLRNAEQEADHCNTFLPMFPTAKTDSSSTTNFSWPVPSFIPSPAVNLREPFNKAGLPSTDVMLIHNVPLHRGSASGTAARQQQAVPPHKQQKENSFGFMAAEMDDHIEELCWQDVHLLPLPTEASGKKRLLLLQSEADSRVEREITMMKLNEMQISMLDQMFPRHVLKHIVSRGMAEQGLQSVDSVAKLATSHDGVSIMFMDIVGFTTMSKEVAPQEVMIFLNSLFTLFDELIDQYQVYKVETAGDCYIVAGALMTLDQSGFLQVDTNADSEKGAEKVMAFSKALLRCAKTVNMPHNGEPTTVRVGIHTGPVVSGLIGTKLPKFSIFGDTMNTASRMESTSQPGCIQVSEVTHKLLQNHTFAPTGGIEVKGKGLMNTYLWDPADNPDEQYSNLMEKNKEETALLQHICKSMISNVLPPEVVADLNSPENNALTDNSSGPHASYAINDFLSMTLPVLRKIKSRNSRGDKLQQNHHLLQSAPRVSGGDKPQDLYIVAGTPPVSCANLLALTDLQRSNEGHRPSSMTTGSESQRSSLELVSENRVQMMQCWETEKLTPAVAHNSPVSDCSTDQFANRTTSGTISFTAHLGAAGTLRSPSFQSTRHDSSLVRMGSTVESTLVQYVRQQLVLLQSRSGAATANASRESSRTHSAAQLSQQQRASSSVELQKHDESGALS